MDYLNVKGEDQSMPKIWGIIEAWKRYLSGWVLVLTGVAISSQFDPAYMVAGTGFAEMSFF